MDDFTLLLVVGGIINLIILIAFYRALAAIRKETSKTNYLLHKIFKQNGGQLSDEDIDFLK